MSLTQIMSHAGLTLYPIVALVLFLLAFVVVLFRLVGSNSAEEHKKFGAIPLQEENTPHQRTKGADE